MNILSPPSLHFHHFTGIIHHSITRLSRHLGYLMYTFLTLGTIFPVMEEFGSVMRCDWPQLERSIASSTRRATTTTLNVLNDVSRDGWATERNRADLGND